jgi:hypothetical protein
MPAEDSAVSTPFQTSPKLAPASIENKFSFLSDRAATTEIDGSE